MSNINKLRQLNENVYINQEYLDTLDTENSNNIVTFLRTNFSRPYTETTSPYYVSTVDTGTGIPVTESITSADCEHEEMPIDLPSEEECDTSDENTESNRISFDEIVNTNRDSGDTIDHAIDEIVNSRMRNYANILRKEVDMDEIQEVKNNNLIDLHCEICNAQLKDRKKPYVCEFCSEKYFDTCGYCDKKYEKKYFPIELKGKKICLICLRQLNYKKCHKCNQWFNSRDMVYVRNDYSYCKSCIKKNNDVFKCTSCGNYYKIERYGENDQCITCVNSQLNEVKNYSYKPEPRFYSKRNEEDNLFFGIELEMGCIKDPYMVNEFVAEYSNNVFYMKKDTSIPIYGCEIVTQPLTLSKHIDNSYWNVLLEAAQKYGFNAEHEKCGLHIHVSRQPISTENIAKLDCFVNTYDFWKKIARRESHYSAYLSKNENVWGMQVSNRRCALNLSNNNTIEFRIFKGTLNYDYIMSYIEVCYAAVHFMNEVTMNELLNEKYNVINKFNKYLQNRKFKFINHYIEKFSVFS